MYEQMQEHDKSTIRRLVRKLLNVSCMVSVYDGEEWAISRTTDYNAIIDAMGNTDMDTVRVRNLRGERIGSFVLVYGNCPGETISDYSDNVFCNAIVTELNL